MKNKILTLCFSSWVMLSLLASCSHHATGGDLVGAWRAEDGETVHFGKDGSYSLKPASAGNQAGAELTGTYTKSQPTQITVKFMSAEHENQAVYDYSVAGDQLTLRGAGTDIVRVYKRTGD